MALSIPVRPKLPLTLDRLLESVRYGEQPEEKDFCTPDYCREFEAVISGTLIACPSCKCCLGDIRPLTRHAAAISPVLSALLRRAAQETKGELRLYRPVSGAVGDGTFTIGADVKDTKGSPPFASCVSGVPLPQDLVLTDKFNKAQYSELLADLQTREVRQPTELEPISSKASSSATSTEEVDAARKRTKLDREAISQQSFATFGRRLAAASRSNCLLLTPMDIAPPATSAPAAPSNGFFADAFQPSMLSLKDPEFLNGLNISNLAAIHARILTSPESTLRLNLVCLLQSIVRELLDSHDLNLADVALLVSRAKPM